jgi:predicted dehydrogenase
MERIKTAIVGLGRIASLLEDDQLREKPCTHAGAVSANPDCLLVAGADIDGERRRLFAERWQVPVYADAAEMLRTERPAILHVATHPDSHFRYCTLAAEHGVSVVVCEKPLADSRRDARKIAALEKSGLRINNPAAERSGYVVLQGMDFMRVHTPPQKGGVWTHLRIITNHERRYSADYIEAREILAEQRLGVLLSAKAVLYMGKTQHLRDVFWHDGTHLVDAVMFLTSSLVEHKKCWGAKLTSRSGTAVLSGYLKPLSTTVPEASPPVPFLIEIGAGREHLVFEMEFSCERGRLRIGNGIFEVWESGPSPYAEKFRSLKKTQEGFEGPTGYFANMVADAAACVRDPQRQPNSRALDGLRVIEYLHRVGR